MPGRTMRRTKAIKRGRKKERKKRRPKRTKIGCALLSASRQPRRTTRPAVCQDTHTHTPIVLCLVGANEWIRRKFASDPTVAMVKSARCCPGRQTWRSPPTVAIVAVASG